MQTIPKTISLNLKYSENKLWFIYCGFGGILFFLIFSLLGILTPHYNSLYQTISSLELEKIGLFQQFNFIIFGILNLFFALSIYKEFPNRVISYFIVFFQCLSAVGLLGDGLYIYNPEHIIFDLITFNSSLIVLILFAKLLYNNQSWKGWSAYSLLSAALMIAFLTAFGIANKNHGVAGLYERMAVLIRVFWSCFFAMSLVKKATVGIMRTQ